MELKYDTWNTPKFYREEILTYSSLSLSSSDILTKRDGRTSNAGKGDPLAPEEAVEKHEFHARQCELSRSTAIHTLLSSVSASASDLYTVGNTTTSSLFLERSLKWELLNAEEDWLRTPEVAEGGYERYDQDCLTISEKLTS